MLLRGKGNLKHCEIAWRKIRTSPFVSRLPTTVYTGGNEWEGALVPSMGSRGSQLHRLSQSNSRCPVVKHQKLIYGRSARPQCQQIYIISKSKKILNSRWAVIKHKPTIDIDLACTRRKQKQPVPVLNLDTIPLIPAPTNSRHHVGF